MLSLTNQDGVAAISLYLQNFPINCSNIRQEHVFAVDYNKVVLWEFPGEERFTGVTFSVVKQGYNIFVIAYTDKTLKTSQSEIRFSCYVVYVFR